jgi:hypothetical protein
MSNILDKPSRENIEKNIQLLFKQLKRGGAKVVKNHKNENLFTALREYIEEYKVADENKLETIWKQCLLKISLISQFSASINFPVWLRNEPNLAFFKRLQQSCDLKEGCYVHDRTRVIKLGQITPKSFILPSIELVSDTQFDIEFKVQLALF